MTIVVARIPWTAFLALRVVLAIFSLPYPVQVVAVGTARQEEQKPTAEAAGERLVVVGSIAVRERAAFFQCYNANEGGADPSRGHDGGGEEGLQARLDHRRRRYRQRCCQAIRRCAQSTIMTSLERLDKNQSSLWNSLDLFRGDPQEALCGDDDFLAVSIPKDSVGRRAGLLDALVELPSVASSFDDDRDLLRHPSTAALRLPLYSLLLCQRQTSTTRIGRPMGAPTPMTSWHHVLWDDLQNRTVDPDDATSLPSWQSELEAAGDGAKFFDAELDSQLSESGGMHRTLRHSVTLRLPAEGARNPAEPKDGSSSSWALDMWILLHLPSDVFVNVQDAFEVPLEDKLNLRTSLVTVKGALIDEEQPEFASPSHAVLLRVQADVPLGENGLSRQKSLAFTTKIHLRYPSPTSGGDSFSRIVMLAPTIVSGTIRRSEATGSVLYQWKSPTSDTKSMHRFAPPPPLLVTWMSAGHCEDLPWVTVVTLLVAVLGSIVMWREISRIADWDR
jgi:hypothetical protein